MGEYELHVMTDGSLPLDELEDRIVSIHDAVDVVHVREKQRSPGEIFALVQRLRQRGVAIEHKVMINDRADVAVLAGAMGVQLPEAGLPADAVKRAYPLLRVGRSVHSISSAVAAERQGADYVLFSPVYPPSCKPDAKATGISLMAQAADQIAIPLIALGGIRPDHTEDLIQHGASGIAVMSGIMQADDPVQAAKAYQTVLQQVRRGEG